MKKSVLVGVGLSCLAGVVAFIYYRNRQFNKYTPDDPFDDLAFDESDLDDFDSDIDEDFDFMSSDFTSNNGVDSDDGYTELNDFDSEFSNTRFKQVCGVSRVAACEFIVKNSSEGLSVNELLVLPNDDLAQLYSKLSM